MNRAVVSSIMLLLLILSSFFFQMGPAKEKINSDLIIKIPEINLEQNIILGSYEMEEINVGVTMFPQSDYPIKKYSNLALAAHNGNTNKSFFKDIYKLEINDLIYIYHNDNIFKYLIIEKKIIFADEVKIITKKYDKRIVTLVTCILSNKKKRLVIIAREK